MEEKKIEKLLGLPKKTILIIFIIAVISLAGIAYLGLNVYEDQNSECKDYSKIIGTSEEKENEYVKLDVSNYGVFAEKDDSTDKFCYLLDGNGEWYIAKLSKSTMEELDKKLSDGNKTFSYEVKGCLKNYPSEVKRIAIETVNDWFKDQEDFKKISLLNFDSAFGKYYIEEGESPNSELYYTLLVFSGIVFFVTVICGMVCGINVLRQNKIIKQFGKDDLKEELGDGSVISLDEQKIYLTRHYVIEGNRPLKVIKYEDIVWAYILHNKTNGIETATFLVIKTLDGKTYNLGSSPRNAESNYQIAMGEILQRNPSVILGYHPDSIKAYKDIIKRK